MGVADTKPAGGGGIMKDATGSGAGAGVVGAPNASQPPATGVGATGVGASAAARSLLGRGGGAGVENPPKPNRSSTAAAGGTGDGCTARAAAAGTPIKLLSGLSGGTAPPAWTAAEGGGVDAAARAPSKRFSWNTCRMKSLSCGRLEFSTKGHERSLLLPNQAARYCARAASLPMP